MPQRYHGNYALLPVLEQLGPTAGSLGVPWAEFVGDRSSRLPFTVPTDDVADPYVALQAYDVGVYGHEVVVNGEPLTGFDIPPADGWQYWFDAITEPELRAGENTVQIRRDTSTVDAFAVGNVIVHWKEPVD